MDLDQLKQILDLVREHELAEFEIEHEGLRLKVRKDAAGALATVPPAGAVPPPIAHAPAPAAAALAPSAGRRRRLPPARRTAEIELAVVKSPIVGTFYRSPEPGRRVVRRDRRRR